MWLIVLQRILGAGIAWLAAVIFVNLGFAWYWLLISFLVYDLSMVGYIKDKYFGAKIYNLGHGMLAPGFLTVAAYFVDSRVLLFVGATWLFHIGVDRALGYGLKLPKGFKYTDMGDL